MMNNKKIDYSAKIKFATFLLFIIALCIMAVKFAPWIIENVKKPEMIREYLLSFEDWGFVVYVLIQAIHVLLVVIPGDIFNVCGGYIFGVPMGFMLSMIGIMLGTVAAFYISRLLGYGYISKFISEEKISKISTLLNSTKGMLGMLILCLIPLIPKDLMMYVAGLTPVKAPRLFFVYAISRIPGTLIWVSIGAQAYEKNVTSIVITLTALAMLIIMSILLQRKFKTKQIQKANHLRASVKTCFLE